MVLPLNQDWVVEQALKLSRPQMVYIYRKISVAILKFYVDPFSIMSWYFLRYDVAQSIPNVRRSHYNAGLSTCKKSLLTI